MTRTVGRILCAVLALSLLFSACGGQEESSSSPSQSGASQSEASMEEESSTPPENSSSIPEERLNLPGGLANLSRFELPQPFQDTRKEFYGADEMMVFFRMWDFANPEQQKMYWLNRQGKVVREESFSGVSLYRFPVEPNPRIDRATDEISFYSQEQLSETLELQREGPASNPIRSFEERHLLLYVEDSDQASKDCITLQNLETDAVRTVTMAELGYEGYACVNIRIYDENTALLNLLKEHSNSQVLLSLPDLTVIQQEPDLISFQLGWEQLLLTPHELEEHQYSCYEKNNNSFLFSRNGDFFLGLEKVPGNDKLSLYDIEGNLLHTVELGDLLEDLYWAPFFLSNDGKEILLYDRANQVMRLELEYPD